VVRIGGLPVIVPDVVLEGVEKVPKTWAAPLLSPNCFRAAEAEDWQPELREEWPTNKHWREG